MTVAAIGGAGMVLAAPAAALLISPAVAQAAPPPVVDPLCPLVGACARGSLGASIAGVLGPAGLADPFGLPTDLLGFAGAIPVLNIFIGNGADGTALHPDGFNGGLFFGNGGKGFTPTAVGRPGVTVALLGCSSVAAAMAATVLPGTPSLLAVVAETAVLLRCSSATAVPVVRVARVVPAPPG
jgi:hypothetical protein